MINLSYMFQMIHPYLIMLHPPSTSPKKWKKQKCGSGCWRHLRWLLPIPKLINLNPSGLTQNDRLLMAAHGWRIERSKNMTKICIPFHNHDSHSHMCQQKWHVFYIQVHPALYRAYTTFWVFQHHQHLIRRLSSIAVGVPPDPQKKISGRRAAHCANFDRSRIQSTNSSNQLGVAHDPHRPKDRHDIFLAWIP